MASKQKLELTWLGKDKEIKIEPRILIEDKENPTVKMILIQRIRGIRFTSSCYNTKAGIEALIIGFLLSLYGLPVIGTTVIAFIELINEKKIKAV